MLLRLGCPSRYGSWNGWMSSAQPMWGVLCVPSLLHLGPVPRVPDGARRRGLSRLVSVGRRTLRKLPVGEILGGKGARLSSAECLLLVTDIFSATQAS